jgi:hypothetical protein
MCGLNPFRVNKTLCAYPRLSLRSNLGLELANAFGVFPLRSNLGLELANAFGVFPLRANLGWN